MCDITNGGTQTKARPLKLSTILVSAWIQFVPNNITLEYSKQTISIENTVLNYKENKLDLQAVLGITCGIASEIEI